MFDYYTKANCELECAWKKAEEVCGCKPWHVPAEDGVKTCFILGNVCFDQIMNKIEKKKMKLDCLCQDDCSYSKYTLSLTDKKILERTTVKVYSQFPDNYILGTDQLIGNNFQTKSYHNMGKTKLFEKNLDDILLIQVNI